ncbi:Hcp family type VI secretion system effector [Roseateles violae]|uniref:Type VI secretion system tube protein Hcp n=1 Tax=Roseateles violae TaxID=3058042 RepID=A0ABT8DPU1_9BURK|nr:type VI secretion system tube protein Hcp [Pelomonas sp. PFR6]MDN3920031.1 type VI secretion system tube protein Hcp [Pelomonas sp. PFR6]
MSSDSTIKFDGIDGEAVKPKGEIEVLSWNWGVSQPASGLGGGTGKGKAIPADFHFTHHYDKASPVLAKHCVAGKHFPTMKLTSRKAGEGQQDFLVVTLKEVFITSVTPGGSTGGDILEQVTCSYKDIEFAYKPQDDKGALGGEVKFGWDLAKTETR